MPRPPTHTPSQAVVPPHSSLLTHFNEQGQAHMVDIGDKASSKRIAIASGTITMQPSTLVLIESATAKKGDVLGIARIAAIQASKRCADLIPLCHPIALTKVSVDFSTTQMPPAVHIRVQAETIGPTGVEMEALVAASVGLLTIYDMCKAVDRGMTIQTVQLQHKSGGHSGAWDLNQNT